MTGARASTRAVGTDVSACLGSRATHVSRILTNVLREQVHVLTVARASTLTDPTCANVPLLSLVRETN